LGWVRWRLKRVKDRRVKEKIWWKRRGKWELVEVENEGGSGNWGEWEVSGDYKLIVKGDYRFD
jgi:hypothetical protein